MTADVRVRVHDIPTRELLNAVITFTRVAATTDLSQSLDAICNRLADALRGEVDQRLEHALRTGAGPGGWA